jgi:uncharacterized membrane protein YgdD (TMEM256/DUF423 family)
MGRIWLLWACIMAFLYVALGAFATHGLKDVLDAGQLDTLATGHRYLGFHALALMGLGLWNHWEKWSNTLLPGLCFLLGSVFFTGSLYLLVFMQWRQAAFLTPLGGGLYLLGWVLFAVAVLRTKSSIV